MSENNKLLPLNATVSVSGCIVPKAHIQGLSLGAIESCLGFNKGRFKEGVAVVELNTTPAESELQYFGDTRQPTDKFEEKRNKSIGRQELNKAAYGYLKYGAKLVKVIPAIPSGEYPPGGGAMQYELKKGIRKPGRVIRVLKNYPTEVFR